MNNTTAPQNNDKLTTRVFYIKANDDVNSAYLRKP